MGFDVDALRLAAAEHRLVMRVAIAEVRGSSPREVGATMLVWDDGQSGTIGGGTLEFEAANAARAGRSGLSRHALGPDLGQCCGGAVTLLTECYDAAAVAMLDGDVIARECAAFLPGEERGAGGDVPLLVRRVLAAARGQGELPEPQLCDGWMIEPVAKPERQLWIWGAGHVGRAIVNVLAPMPEIAITWVDTGAERYPERVPDSVTVLPAVNPADLIGFAPIEAEHLILTYSHNLDLELCHRLLGHGFGFAGLIGSKTKWSRFRLRLDALGHPPDQVARISCPIGVKALGKHPQAIAIGVAGQLLDRHVATAAKQRRATA